MTAFYIGNYGENGIARVVLQDDRLKLVETFPAVNPSYLCLSPDQKHVYAVSETLTYRGKPGGSVVSYDVTASGRLTQTSVRPTIGTDPCHVSIVDGLLLVSNYTSGSLSRYPILPDGTLGEMLPLIQHTGRGPRRDRQECAHVHQAQLTPYGSIAVNDLGLDSVFFYSLPDLRDDQPKALTLHAPAGFGPRHAVFPQSGEVFYILCELQSQLLIYRGRPENAFLIGRLPIGSPSAQNAPAALRLSPDGKLLAATGRGQDVIDLFSVMPGGQLARLTEVSSGGRCPRDIQFTPDGKALICANQDSNLLTAFRIENGHLIRFAELALQKPSCVLVAPNETEETA